MNTLMHRLNMQILINLVPNIFLAIYSCSAFASVVSSENPYIKNVTIYECDAFWFQKGPHSQQCGAFYWESSDALWEPVRPIPKNGPSPVIWSSRKGTCAAVLLAISLPLKNLVPHEGDKFRIIVTLDTLINNAVVFSAAGISSLPTYYEPELLNLELHETPDDNGFSRLAKASTQRDVSVMADSENAMLLKRLHFLTLQKSDALKEPTRPTNLESGHYLSGRYGPDAQDLLFKRKGLRHIKAEDFSSQRFIISNPALTWESTHILNQEGCSHRGHCQIALVSPEFNKAQFEDEFLCLQFVAAFENSQFQFHSLTIQGVAL